MSAFGKHWMIMRALEIEMGETLLGWVGKVLREHFMRFNGKPLQFVVRSRRFVTAAGRMYSCFDLLISSGKLGSKAGDKPSLNAAASPSRKPGAVNSATMDMVLPFEIQINRSRS